VPDITELTTEQFDRTMKTNICACCSCPPSAYSLRAALQTAPCEIAPSAHARVHDLIVPQLPHARGGPAHPEGWEHHRDRVAGCAPPAHEMGVRTR
jgi:hypothetical protein